MVEMGLWVPNPGLRSEHRLRPGDAAGTFRLRIAAWDVICTLAILGALLLLATMTKWPSTLFGFMSQVCEGDECGAVPFGIDYYIRPLVWGGIGAAITAATIGPFVSMLKGWYMSFLAGPFHGPDRDQRRGGLGAEPRHLPAVLRLGPRRAAPAPNRHSTDTRPRLLR